MSAQSFVTALLESFSEVLEPITDAVSPLGDTPPSLDELEAFLADFGWTLDLTGDPAVMKTAFGSLPEHIRTLVTDAGQLTANSSATEISTVVADLARAVADIGALASGAGTSFSPFDLQDFWTGPDSFPEELWPYLMHRYLQRHAPPLYGILRFLGVLTETQQPLNANNGRLAYQKLGVKWDRIPQYGSRPGPTFAGVYHWADAAVPFDHTGFIRGLGALTSSFPVGSGVATPTNDVVAMFYPGAAPGDLLQLSFSPIPTFDISGPVEVVVKLIFGVIPIPGSGAPTPVPVGLALFPVLSGAAKATFDVSDTFSVSLDGHFKTVPVVVEFEPASSGGIDARINPVTLQSLGANTTLDGTVRLIASAPQGSPWILIGSAASSHLELSSAYLGVKADGPLTALEYTVLAGLEGLKLVIDLSDSDGFIQTMVGSQPQDIDLSCGLQWSRRSGFSFTGHAEIAATIPVHITIAEVLAIDTVYIALEASTDGAGGSIDVAVTGGLMLGPVAASVDKIGVRVKLKKDPSGHGNLGDLDLQFGFKPPKGIGIAVDAAVASGGGYIFLDPDKGEYAGIFAISVDLPVLSVQVNVAGVLDTIMPGGQTGFSLIFFLVARFDPGFQLGFGFTLNGVGGLVGINRTMAFEPLRTAFKSHHLENIFFPPDPQAAIANAPQTISDLSSIFPVMEGHYVFGPLLVLGWGAPDTIIEAEFGGVLELPTFRLALFGLFRVGLPTLEEPDPEAVLVFIKIDILGLIDFEQKKLSIDGELYDSRVVEFALSGQMALRLGWGDQPEFAVSIGGLNPRFQPPAGFPTLNRLMISLDSSWASVSLSSYFAVTSNSVQVGADFELRASACGFTVHGYFGFDALFYLSPFSFIVDMRAGVDVLSGNTVLFGIDLSLTLSGPKPWHAYGEGSVHFLFFSITVPVDVTIGDAADAPPLPRADVWPLLESALKDPRNWSATLPSENDRVVAFAQAPTSDQTLLVHPIGRLKVHERVVPLDYPISLFSSATPNDYNQFKVLPPRLNGTQPDYAIEKDYFARGQFEALADGDKLSKPSYEPFDAAISIGSTSVKSGYESLLNMHYETYYVGDHDVPGTKVQKTYQPKLDIQHALARQSAAAYAASRLSGATKYVAPGTDSPIDVGDATYVIASTDTLEVRSMSSVPSDGTTLAAAEAALQAHMRAHPEDEGSLQIVSNCEAV